MIADYAFGWATLTWWTYVILAAVVILSTWLACRLVERDELSQEWAAKPCLMYMGDVFGEDGFHPVWCHLMAGHEDEHRDHDGLTVADRLYQDH